MRVWGDLRTSWVWSPSPSRVNTELRWGGTGLCPKEVWKSAEMGSLQPLWETCCTSWLSSRWHVDYNMCSLNFCSSCSLTLLSIPTLQFPPCRHQNAVRCPEAVPAPDWTSPSPTDLVSPGKLTECVRSPSQVSNKDMKHDRPQDRPLQSSFSKHQKLLCLCLVDTTIQGVKTVF